MPRPYYRSCQRRKQVDEVAVGVGDLRVALSPEGIPRLLVPAVAALDNALIQSIDLSRTVAFERQADALPHRLDPLGVDALDHFLAVPRNTIPIRRDHLDVRFALAVRRRLQAQQPIEAQRG